MDILLTFAGNRDPFNPEVVKGVFTDGPVLTLLTERSFAAVHIFTTPNTLPNAQQLQQEIADRGTIFLDEIGDMPLPAQAKILRVLQDKAITRVGGEKTISADVRIIAATNRDLTIRVAVGKFREDLYYRLHVIDIPMPALRERREDIPLLMEYFLDRHNRRYHQKKQFNREAAARLLKMKPHTFRKRAKEKFGL